MRTRELAVSGAHVFEPEIYRDRRGSFCSPHQNAAFTGALGRQMFPVAQVSTSRSQRGVVRGIHFTAGPDSMAKYVLCTGGRALDVVIDLRLGSPTFGRHDRVELSPDTGAALYLPPGVGHLFVALGNDTTMVYLLSAAYRADRERAVHPLDPALGLDLPTGLEPVLSDRDQDAPALAAARAAGLLPDYAELHGGEW
ncbi:dTDP-4-dehydrorhamnose 3,5-epimerase family protein [Streptomyces sp. ISL-10]|uniref:dTDP-4-dehydrorhamnose 3,5-epimerase family protein n=1 Tax=Streptomyces sp. ISL-10 TaxID=2819172 RepID=UPI001BE7E5F0|nr:dTDP-4-dehydrorhamnose 3,5-epimerase family protein [Streptomyces sp. ISL-10]MBT2368640.1 dTDP-4-dehydrorhamnose 3,5-epimerase family protein [Streptomyces sp. ISL-10]